MFRTHETKPPFPTHLPTMPLNYVHGEHHLFPS